MYNFTQTLKNNKLINRPDSDFLFLEYKSCHTFFTKKWSKSTLPQNRY